MRTYLAIASGLSNIQSTLILITLWKNIEMVSVINKGANILFIVKPILIWAIHDFCNFFHQLLYLSCFLQLLKCFNEVRFIQID